MPLDLTLQCVVVVVKTDEPVERPKVVEVVKRKAVSLRMSGGSKKLW
jgi:hypothetical protein